MIEENPTLEQILTEHRGNLAVLVMDMQDYFMRDKEKEDKDAKIGYQKKLLEYAKSHNILIVFLEQTHVIEALGETIPELKGVASGYENVESFKKASMDCFLGTDLNAYLKSRNIEYLFVMGCNAEACVRKTIRTALKNGFKVYTSKDVLLSYTSSWQRMKRAFEWFDNYLNGKVHYKEKLHTVVE